MADNVINAHQLRHHFGDLTQQREAATLGMWIFLVTEVMFFGGLFAAYTVYRSAYPQAWEVGSEHMDFWLGTINTVILLCSSFTMAMAVWATQLGRRTQAVMFMILTMAMGTAFEVFKGIEYYRHYLEGSVPMFGFWHMPAQDAQHVQMFFYLYFIITGLHALHLAIGIVVVGFIAWFAWHKRYSPQYTNPVMNTGLYWHFVDIVWIFLYPLLYLISHKHV